MSDDDDLASYWSDFRETIVIDRVANFADIVRAATENPSSTPDASCLDSLSPEELKDFVQALPKPILDKVVQAGKDTVTGVHGLLAFEWHRRKGHIGDYEIYKDYEKLMVRIVTPADDEVRFRVDEQFELDG